MNKKLLLKIYGTLVIIILVLFSHSLIVLLVACFSLLMVWGDRIPFIQNYINKKIEQFQREA
jgi:hypothetical protein